MPAAEKLRTLLARPEFSWLIDRLVARIEQGKPIDSGTTTLRRPSAAQRSAIDDLLGRPSSIGQSLSVHFARLLAVLRLHPDELIEVVESVRGPVTLIATQRAAAAACWQRLFQNWQITFREASDTAMLIWLEKQHDCGYLKRVSARDPELAHTLVANTWKILQAAPHNDILLATLAAQVTGDSHALDRNRPLAGLCLRAIEQRHGIDGGDDGDARREAWASIGVCVDDLSAAALCLNLPCRPDLDMAQWINWHVERGEPFYLTWRQLRDFVPSPGCGDLFCCENPAVVSEAANRLGPRSRPLVCLNGVPASAPRRLLKLLLEAGEKVHLRADFDWAGLRIVDRLHRPGKTLLWRMTLADYHACQPTRRLEGSEYRPDWATDLADEMSRTGLAAFEEELIQTLLLDLHNGIE